MNIYGKIVGKAEILKSVSTVQGEKINIKTLENDKNATINIVENLKKQPGHEKPPVSSPSLRNEKTEIKNEWSHKIIPNITNAKPEMMEIQDKRTRSEFNPSLWMNKVLLDLCESSDQIVQTTEPNIDISQEIYINYMVFKVFENEERNYDNILWRKLIIRSIPISIQKSKNSKFIDSNDIQIKEEKIRTKIQSDPLFINKLLLTISEENQDSSLNGSRKHSDVSSDYLLTFFPKINELYQKPQPILGKAPIPTTRGETFSFHNFKRQNSSLSNPLNIAPPYHYINFKRNQPIFNQFANNCSYSLSKHEKR